MSGRVYQVETYVRVLTEDGDTCVYANVETDVSLESATGEAVVELTNYSYYDHDPEGSHP